MPWIAETLQILDWQRATKFNDVKSSKGTPFDGFEEESWLWAAVIYGVLVATVLEMLTRQVPYSHLESD
ncbi:hypothetical protein IFM89_032572 [Coptis chinensis]|uniref:Uncharacterized protein n=1 Tax=Coptis chinensis TaxID=261450 RepID=A0A835IRA5_9MAGN|nr:hypothetical protein IFM89_032572 [Coptis chinensis]